MNNNINFNEKLKLKYTTKGLFFTVITLFFLTIVNVYFKNLTAYFLGIACLVTTIVYIYIKRTKKIIIPAIVLVITGYSLITFSLITRYKYENILDTLWYVILTTVAYYLLGKRFGITFLAICASTIGIVKTLAMNNYLIHHNIQDISSFKSIDFIINLAVTVFVLGFLFDQIISTNNDSQKQLSLTNKHVQEQNDEKTVMLKEIHHRVKNNLQVITSLLRLQLYKLEDEKMISVFQESINRITTMALIHEKMYKGNKINGLSVKNYITDLTTDIVRTYATTTKVQVSVNSNIDQLEMNDLVPFSLILNELITNSIKHGFKDQLKGSIDINLQSTAIGFDLGYKDSGIWKKNTNKQNFGLELIETLNGHFDGIFHKTTSNSGTEYIFNLKVY